MVFSPEYHHQVCVIFTTLAAHISEENTSICTAIAIQRQEVRLLWILFQELAVISVLLELTNQMNNIAQAYGTQY